MNLDKWVLFVGKLAFIFVFYLLLSMALDRGTSQSVNNGLVAGAKEDIKVIGEEVVQHMLRRR